VKPAARQIEVTAIGGRDFGVLVNGVHWCFAKHEPRGMHGASYTLRYHAQSEPITERVGRGSAPSDVVIWSDKHWLSSQGFYGSGGMAKHRAVHEGKYKTIQDRIAETAARLIKKGLIVSPAELSQRAQIARVAQQRRVEQAEADDRKRLDAKAKEVIEKFAVGETVVYQEDRNRLGLLIIEAMEWARSNT
jgi:hypothetical protein